MGTGWASTPNSYPVRKLNEIGPYLNTESKECFHDFMKGEMKEFQAEKVLLIKVKYGKASLT